MGRMCAFVPRMMQHKAVARANIGKDLTPRGTQCPEAETLRGKKLAKEYARLLKKKEENSWYWQNNKGERRRFKKLEVLLGIKKEA